MSAPRLLDLFCGAGGCSVGYARAGFDVVGVDIAPQPRYPFEFHQADALDVLAYKGRFRLILRDFDVIHASPPCQSFTAYRRRGDGVGDDYENLIPQTRALLEDSGRHWVMENVAGAPLENPIMLCGSSFGLDVRRHRYFESNRALLALPCQHDAQTPRFPPATNRANLRSTVEVGAWRCAHLAPAAMDVDWMTNAELSQAVPPAYTEFIGAQLLAQFVSHHGKGTRDD